MKNSRITHIITGLGTGGAERALYNLLRAGLNKRFNNHVISLSDMGTTGEKIKAIGVEVLALNLQRGLPTASGLLLLRQAINNFKPGLLQGWMYHGNIAASMARALSSGDPSLAWNIRHSLYKLSHEKFMTQQIIRLNRSLSARPHALIYNSQLSKKQHEGFGFNKNKGLIIANGVDLERYCFSKQKKDQVRLELSIPPDATLIGHVARLHPMKDHLTFLKAAAIIAQQYPNTHFLLAGRNVSLENAMLKMPIPDQLSNRFHLIGERDDIPSVMCSMDIFCQSSWSEAFPNVLGEAMATELPCVATDVGDSALIVGETGKIVPPHSVNALVSGIEALLNLPPESRKGAGKRARHRIMENFTLHSIVEQYSRLYERLLATKDLH